MQIIHAQTALTADGWQDDVAVTIGDDGLIAALGPQTGTADHGVGLLLPAPTNLHSHTFQRAMSGLTEARGPSGQDSFWTWRKLMYQFLDHLTPDQIEAIAAFAFMEMLEAGFGAVAEFHYLHHDVGGHPFDNPAETSERIVAAAQSTGIGLTLLPVLYQHGGCDRTPLAGGQRRFGTTPDSFAELHACATAALAQGRADFRIGVAPHSLRAVDQTGLALCKSLAGSDPLHMHLAEQVAEVAEVEANLGARPVTWLLDNHDVTDQWCLIHCTQMTPDETTALARTGAVAGLCPITEASLGDGIFPATEFRAAGGRLGVGSDSNIQISLFDELRSLEYSQRLRDKSRAALATPSHSTGRVLFDAARQGGAQAAARNSGTIAPGNLADLVACDLSRPNFAVTKDDQHLDSLIFGGQAAITDTWSMGDHVVRNGTHRDRRQLTDRYKLALSELNQ